MWYETVVVILNLVVIESLLSIDNASALAAMVQHLPYKQRYKALRYGLVGAYLFRGICLFIISGLMKFICLKIIGGGYLLWLTYKFFESKNESSIRDKKNTKGFWATVISVEILDLSLSLDNIFAAAALSNKFWIIMTGVAIGILAMRFVAGWFIRLIEIHPRLQSSAFIVIFLLGLKLIVSGIFEYSTPFVAWKIIMESKLFGFIFSLMMLVVFLFPLIFRKKEVVYGKNIN